MDRVIALNDNGCTLLAMGCNEGAATAFQEAAELLAVCTVVDESGGCRDGEESPYCVRSDQMTPLPVSVAETGSGNALFYTRPLRIQCSVKGRPNASSLASRLGLAVISYNLGLTRHLMYSGDNNTDHISVAFDMYQQSLKMIRIGTALPHNHAASISVLCLNNMVEILLEREEFSVAQRANAAYKRLLETLWDDESFLGSDSVSGLVKNAYIFQYSSSAAGHCAPVA